MNDEQREEPQSISESDARELELESSMADEEVEDDEEEIDVDASLAACLESRLAVGTRRSARLIDNEEDRLSRTMAQLMHEQDVQERLRQQ